MAKTTTSTAKAHLLNPKKKIGRHRKKDSRNKKSKNYNKPYRGQGR